MHKKFRLLPRTTRILTTFAVCLILASSVILIRPAFPAGNVTLPFQDGFESGNFSKWSVNAGGYVTSGNAQHGTYKAVLNATGQYQQARFTAVDHCFFRAYVMFKSFPRLSGYETPVLGLYNTSGIYMAEVRVRNVSGTVEWALRYYNSGHNTVVSTQQRPVLDTWYCVEVEGKSNSATASESRIYINGNELTDVTKTGLNNNYKINCAYIWESYSLTPAVVQWYDDVVVDTSYIGPEAYTLTTSVVGQGSINKSPDQTTYNWGTNVTLTAHANLGWTFANWTGGASGTSTPVTITITDNTAVTATFIRSGEPITIHVPGDYPTITQAIAAAMAGDTVLVDPGTYNEEVVINKAVNVTGSGAGSTFIDGTGVTLDSPGLVKITAAGDVTFTGFTVQNAPAVDGVTVGIFSESSVPDITYTISYNNIYGTNDPDNAEDYGFYSYSDCANVILSHNLITQTGANNVLIELHTGATEISYNTLDAGVYGSDAVFIMTYGGLDVTTLQNVSYNTFDMGTGGPFDYDHRASAISFNTWPIAPDAKFTDVVIEGNNIGNLESYRRGIGFWNGGGGGGGVIDPLVKSNNVTGVVGAAESYGIDFIGAGATTNADILNNRIFNCSYGIYLRTADCALGAQIYFNEISGNTVGLDNTVGSSDVDARYNYWGDPTGPYNAVSNPSGLGNPVTANVDYRPYLGVPSLECSLTVGVIGSGLVVKDPDQTVFDWGTNVTLTATATIGWSFDHWSGDASGTINSITINMTSDKTVTATFTQNEYTLTVNTVGSGSVNLNNTGPYHYGDIVELTAVPSTDWSFDHWSGDLSGTVNPDTIQIDGNKDVTATFNQTSISDIAILSVETSKTVVGQGCSLTINVIVENQGDHAESFTLTLYCNTTLIGTRSVTLPGGSSAIHIFTWNTTGFAKGDYTISAYALPVPGETDTADNTYIGGQITVAMIGDVSGPTLGVPDGQVDIRDLAYIAKLYGVDYPNPRYNANCDLTGSTPGLADGKIDIRDIAMAAKNFGK